MKGALLETLGENAPDFVADPSITPGGCLIQSPSATVDATTLPANVRVTHVSLFDGSLQGFERTDKPAFCFQGHPEASPGPHDVDYLFDRFVKMIEQHKPHR